VVLREKLDPPFSELASIFLISDNISKYRMPIVGILWFESSRNEMGDTGEKFLPVILTKRSINMHLY
jgi:hypothetical protein